MIEFEKQMLSLYYAPNASHVKTLGRLLENGMITIAITIPQKWMPWFRTYLCFRFSFNTSQPQRCVLMEGNVNVNFRCCWLWGVFKKMWITGVRFHSLQVLTLRGQSHSPEPFMYSMCVLLKKCQVCVWRVTTELAQTALLLFSNQILICFFRNNRTKPQVM